MGRTQPDGAGEWPRVAMIDDEGASKGADGSASSSGFRARLEGINLFDLVQMECLARAQKIIRVASGGRAGYLFFRDGQVVHAATRSSTGERAALEILSWTDGSFEPCHIAWPERMTITRPWQSLVLTAAKIHDEEAAGKLVRLPTRVDEHASVSSEEAPPRTSAPPREASAPESRPSSRRGQAGIQRAVRIDPSGKVVSRAGDTEQLAGFAAYASRLAELIGGSLGLEKFVSLEVELEGSRCVLYVEESGSLVAVQAKSSVDLGSITRRAGI